MKNKTKFEDYTEAEFLNFLELLCSNPTDISDEEFELRTNRMVSHFKEVTEHPAGSDVIFYPEEGQEDSPEGMLKTVKEWREKNGKPGFRKPDAH
ncbi:bacteriocin immunity protein [Pseudomonas sp. 21LCFQ010]|uniref:bacteriocin immunity protein n=1 Tax=Pseudomonas sp. 21LCFQ010 TaxID=2957506 RepID=UPI002096FEC5|nr:bacteriocin immunity protein [Pseudomonas sp. 21LCFQ010]MCO8165300.1 bacteriocin immunity protein [Pseudomonas sp. 21LCFQ010]